MWFRRALYGILAIFVLTIPFFLSNVYWLHVLILVLMNIILATSLGLIVQTGQISFAHPAFMAIGAYGCTLLVTEAGLSYWVAFLLGSLFAGIIAFLIGYPILRIKGAYFFLVTFALLEFIRRIVSFFRYPFGGTRGVIRIPSPTLTIPGLPKIEFVVGGNQYYYFILFICAVTIFVVFRMEKSRYGRIFKSIAQNDCLAESLGINLMKYKLLAFVIGCFIAGAAGAFYAPYFTFISPESFNLSLAIFIIVYIIVGGVGRVIGAIVGTTVLTILPEALSATGYYKMMIFSVVLVAVVMFLPGGLITFPSRIFSRFVRRE